MEKISEFKNREIVENIIKEVYGTDYHIEPVISEDIAPISARESADNQNKPENKPEEDEFVKTALEVFEGAEVIS